MNDENEIKTRRLNGGVRMNLNGERMAVSASVDTASRQDGAKEATSGLPVSCRSHKT